MSKSTFASQLIYVTADANAENELTSNLTSDAYTYDKCKHYSTFHDNLFLTFHPNSHVKCEKTISRAPATLFGTICIKNLLFRTFSSQDCGMLLKEMISQVSEGYKFMVHNRNLSCKQNTLRYSNMLRYKKISS